MKITEKKKPISTIPEGVWEGGIVNDRKPVDKKEHLNEITTDSQGNGYPVTLKGTKKEP